MHETSYDDRQIEGSNEIVLSTYCTNQVPLNERHHSQFITENGTPTWKLSSKIFHYFYKQYMVISTILILIQNQLVNQIHYLILLLFNSFAKLRQFLVMINNQKNFGHRDMAPGSIYLRVGIF